MRVRPILRALLVLALLATPALALAKGRLGFSVNIATSGAEGTIIQQIEVDAVHPGSAAEKAGLRQGDIITTLDGKPLKDTDARAFQAALGGAAPGQHLKLLVLRAGKPVPVEVIAAQG